MPSSNQFFLSFSHQGRKQKVFHLRQQKSIDCEKEAHGAVPVSASLLPLRLLVLGLVLSFRVQEASTKAISMRRCALKNGLELTNMVWRWLTWMVASSLFNPRKKTWCSFRSLRISPLHRKFPLPLPYSSLVVSTACPGLSPGIWRRT